jgi:hypothetical protein
MTELICVAPTATRYVFSFDACFYRDKLKWNKKTALSPTEIAW